MGYAELLLNRNPTNELKKRWLHNIFNNTKRIGTLVDDLLNVSCIHSGKIGLRLERAQLIDILQETLYLARESTDKHEFVTDIEPGLPGVLIDPGKFFQIIANLLSNAVKYSPAGGRIILSACNDPERHQVVVSISDEGIGISPADREMLFTTFHRIHRPETQGIWGSGLGLYITKELTEAMGGKIWLESELNKGSTFFVAFPHGSPENESAGIALRIKGEAD
jgi:signal transduction histidine kinase